MKYFLLTFVVLFGNEIYSQSCLSFSNPLNPFMFEVGYGFQNYSAEGINKYIDVYNKNRVNTLTKKMDSFGTSKGYYLTWRYTSLYFEELNLNYFATFHFSSSSEKQSAQANEQKRSYEITVNSIGAGMGFSMLYRNLNFRLFEGILTLNSGKLVNTLTGVSTPTEQTLKSDGSTVGVIAQVGIDIYLPQYFLMFSGSAGYNFFFIKNMKFDNGSYLVEYEGSTDKMYNFIDNGGLFINIKAGLYIDLFK